MHKSCSLLLCCSLTSIFISVDVYLSMHESLAQTNIGTSSFKCDIFLAALKTRSSVPGVVGPGRRCCACRTEHPIDNLVQNVAVHFPPFIWGACFCPKITTLISRDSELCLSCCRVIAAWMHSCVASPDNARKASTLMVAGYVGWLGGEIPESTWKHRLMFVVGKSLSLYGCISVANLASVASNSVPVTTRTAVKSPERHRNSTRTKSRGFDARHRHLNSRQKNRNTTGTGRPWFETPNILEKKHITLFLQN
jgi:hypothetical protein